MNDGQAEQRKSLIEEILGEGGLVSRFHDSFEYREGQIQMANAVANALEAGRHAIIEAGTGTGKTLAYLVPAICHAVESGKRIIISTGTKNLQEQLIEKDIPFLQGVMDERYKGSYALMKGRANYLCLYRMARSEHQPLLDGIADVDHFREVHQWARTTVFGDRAELTHLPENLTFWNRINAKSDTCIGQKCPEFETCFITKMRSRAEAAEIVVVNHHLFFADLNVRNNNFGRVLPDYDAVIFDEAHLIEDIAADYFGFQASNYQIEEMVRDADKLEITDANATAAIVRIGAKIIGIADIFWNKFRRVAAAEGRFPLDGREEEVSEAHTALDAALNELELKIDFHAGKLPDAENLVWRIRQMRFSLAFVIKQDDGNFVYWIERRNRGIYLQASPIDVSGLLSEKLFDRVRSCILTSATMSANTDFRFIRDRLGIPAAKADTLIAGSSFDYESQALVYLPKAMPDPRSQDFIHAAADEIVKILQVTRGRAFVLCTSNASMISLHDAVSGRIGHPCLLQGTMSKSGLIEQFRETKGAVLFATQSFWQGVDVRGEQLSCVIIDKLPFAVPTDPLVAARSKYIDENGGRSFTDYSIPQAIITLKQGVGRLIRSKADRGVIVILDQRLRTKPYGKIFLSSLPRMRITNDLSAVAAMLDEGK